MIVYKKGDLTESRADVLIHGCNCFHTMRAGVARAIVRKWPRALEADKRTKRGEPRKLGHFSLSSGTPHILNLYTQFTYGRNKRHLDYPSLMSGMHKAKKWLERQDPNHHWRVAIPRIGAGLAGGDWATIESIINDVFHDREIEVWTL